VVSGSEDEAPRKKGRAAEKDAEEEDRETAAEKRVRLAKQYLAQMEAAMGSEEDEEGPDEDGEDGGGKDALGLLLEKERLKASGSLRRALAGSLSNLTPASVPTQIIKGHKLSPTCVTVTRDERTAFTGSKDNAILQYDLETGVRTAVLSPHWRGGQGYQAHEKEVLAMAVSSDGRFLAAGGRDKEIRIWDLRERGGGKGPSLKPVKTFAGHRDAVSALRFRADAHALYSGSYDRCLKHWNLDGMVYVETLFGHQAEINGMDAWRRERPVTCGRDRSVRVWKLVDESHMLLKCPQGVGEGGAGKGLVMGGSLDCVAMLSEESYVTGGEDGMLALWNVNKKKPVAIVPSAHGGAGHWISSVATIKGTDLVASGSDDGVVRLWQATTTAQGQGSSLTFTGTALTAPGYVNGLALGHSGSLLVAACGKEHRLGRWAPQKEAVNGLYVMRLPLEEAREGGGSSSSSEEEDDEDEDDEENMDESGEGGEEEDEEGSEEDEEEEVEEEEEDDE
jgi:ribosomal RNA-processing protein 9